MERNVEADRHEVRPRGREGAVAFSARVSFRCGTGLLVVRRALRFCDALAGGGGAFGYPAQHLVAHGGHFFGGVRCGEQRFCSFAEGGQVDGANLRIRLNGHDGGFSFHNVVGHKGWQACGPRTRPSAGGGGGLCMISS